MADHLPSEVFTEILTSLPLKTLLRCTSVCKSWYFFITSPSFITSHLNLSIANKNQSSRLLLRSYTQDSTIEKRLSSSHITATEKEHFSLHYDNPTFHQIAKLDFPFTSANGYFRIIGTLNGLVCLSDDALGYLETIILWNPSLKKSVVLPKPGFTYGSHGPYQHSIGFGFVPATNDYKIVRVVYLQLLYGDKIMPKVEIYELGTGSWRNVNPGDFSYDIRERASQAFLNGIVHWVGYNPEGAFERMIVSFDMGSEKFGALMVPNSLQKEWLLRVSTFGESLSLIHHKDNSCCVWVMEEYSVANSWTKQFTIDLGQHGFWRPLYHREHGDILLVRHSINSIFDSGNLVSYDPKHKQIKNLGFGNAYSFYVDTYMESLVLVKGSNEVLGRLENFGSDVGTAKKPFKGNKKSEN